MSITPITAPSMGSRITQAEQVQRWMPEQKCSVACTWMGCPVCNAVPIAFVPQVVSLQLLPGSRWVFSTASRSASLVSPSKRKTMPSASVSTITVPVSSR
ncbi:hypothetical protein ACVWWO_001998 [Bradyrhizobium sp. F1.13.1]